MSKNHSFSGYESIRTYLSKKGAKIRFIGIGGVGMYSLAMLCAKLGYSVSGSDREGGVLADKLIGAGISVQIGNSPREIDGTDLVVYSLAISEEDGELSRAAELNIPAVSRAELLGALMRNYLTRISVSGTHGKSTVTAMLDAIFELDGKRPTTLAGASLPGLDSPLRIGSEEWFICEACEYKDSFLMLSPTLSVFTNLEFDHPDYFLNFDMLKDSFSSAMDLSGICVVNADDPVLCEIARDKRCEIVTVGEGENAEYRIANIENRRGKYFFEISHALTPSVKIGLKIQGRFNIANAALAAVTALRMGVCSEIIERALREFHGVERRLEKIGSLAGGELYYDYAHHPTEIRCSIEAIRETNHRQLTVIFKPHTYTRTASLFDEFAEALSLADRVVLCEVSAIRENPIEGISSAHLAEKIGKKATFLPDTEVLKEVLCERGSDVLIMGAANLEYIKNQLLGYTEK